MTYPKRGVYARNDPAEYVWVSGRASSRSQFGMSPRVLYRVLWTAAVSPGHEACLVSLDEFQREFALVHDCEEGPGEARARTRPGTSDEPDWEKAYAELRALVVQDVPLEEGLTKHQGQLVKHLTRYPAPEKS